MSCWLPIFVSKEINKFMDNDFNKINSLIEKAINLQSRELIIRGYNCKRLPENIGNAVHLSELFIEGINLEELPASIGNLHNLDSLYLSENKIRILPNSIAKLKSIRTLGLSNNRFNKIPPQVFKLRYLHNLYLNGNEIAVLDPKISELHYLEYLDFSFNKISQIPENFSKLKNLKFLDLMYNKIRQFPKELVNNSNLVDLNLGSNLIDSIDHLSSMEYLQSITLESNRIYSIPLDISKMQNLKSLNLSYNNIRVLPRELSQIGTLKELNVENNPLVVPPIEILYDGIKAIENYYDSIGEQETFYLYEAKLLIVGSGGVGKTTILNCLVDSEIGDLKSIKTTEGIKVENWYLKTDKNINFRVNIWDFGGQEIYHATHQFFLTKRSLYVFVWDARTDDNLLSFDYWLNIIDLLSDSSPVIVIMNKLDERNRMLDEESLKRKFPNIKSFHKVSALNGVGLDYLKTLIREQVVTLPHVGDTLPIVWKEIREHLEKLNDNYISYKEYLKLCHKFNLSKPRAVYLSRYFHILGVFLHFEDNPLLKNTLILKPEWATQAVYKIVDNIEVQKKYGVLEYTQLSEIWELYPHDKYEVLIELMKKFELCFEIANSKVYIIPELLNPVKPSFGWDEDNNLRFEYSYKFMPAGLITRLIVRIHDLIKNDFYWKNGFILTFENTEALVIAEGLDRKIRIWLNGSKKRELLAIIRREIYAIHKSLNNLFVEERIQCICSECNKSFSPYFHIFDDLYIARQKNRKSTECKKSFQNVNIEELLGSAIGPNSEEGISTPTNPTINIDNSLVNFADSIGDIIK